MKTLLRLLLDLCLLRIGPQDLPYSPGLTRALVVVSVGLSMMFVTLFGNGQRDISHLAVSFLLLLALPRLLLRIRQRDARYVQSLAAFAGARIVLTIVMLPIAVALVDAPLPDAATPPTPPQLMMMLLSLLLLGWKLSIDGNIWRHALDWPKIAGLLLALACFVFELTLIQLLLPAAAT